ncbi:Nud1p KNAG_0E00130 [Huiozyma naganishii CBS 8797]|uniref:Uncharacterized protein n=1 Tax=Huiozyma naganishii (strain ATCC MYA-139 / BCRC 22969 / CBS 8797 / KCTC 17520 / NBRC 10181 / NCYC 3082 / Yp74L-3) TaxID=1071383 RepID=J7S7E3_HUIN7|nr:hypothetical protein KNAG_0E00130 [Kazachstania naganishii CBS 8797]CCK70281.1 hypothetical protein KNAG_0E00130 [Kazachstania naganishii CBS 8797]
MDSTDTVDHLSKGLSGLLIDSSRPSEENVALIRDYKKNQSFNDSNFTSKVYDEGKDVNDDTSSSTDSRTDHLMDFGTVQKRTKSTNKTTVGSKEPAQYMNYLPPKREQKGEQVDRHADLIIKDMGYDLSGDLQNTFKRQSDKAKSSSSHLNQVAKDTDSSFDNPISDAHQVFDNLIKQKQSMQFFDLREEDTAPKEKRQPLFRQRSDQRVLRDKTNIEKMQLITPSSIGLNFKNNVGAWVPNNNNNIQDISTSNDDSQTTHSHMSTGHGTVDDFSENITASTEPPLNESATSSPLGMFESGGSSHSQNQFDDTPIAKPELKTQPLFKREPLGKRESYHDGDMGNVTHIDDINMTEFEQNKQELISTLTDIKVGVWSQARSLNASGRNIKSIVGITHLFPNVVLLDVSNNILESLNERFIRTKYIDLSFNKLKSAFISFHSDNTVESLNLSHNLITGGLSFLNYEMRCLKKVDLSFNSIDSLHGLGNDNSIESVSLRGNNLSGIIDFQELVSNDDDSDNFFPTGWRSVRHLDLSNNHITAVRNLSQLPNLATLNLEGNSIREVTFCGELTYLRELRLCDNDCQLQDVEIPPSDHHSVVLPLLELFTVDCVPLLQSITYRLLPRTLLHLKIKNGSGKHLPPWSHVPHNLRTLTLSGIPDLDLLPTEVDYGNGIQGGMDMLLTSLVSLDLSHNDLHSWHNLIQFIPFINLSTIKLRGNQRLIRSKKDAQDLAQLLQMAVPSLHSIEL